MPSDRPRVASAEEPRRAPVVGIPAIQRGNQIRMMPVLQQRAERMRVRADERYVRQGGRNEERYEREHRQRQELQGAMRNYNMVDYYRLGQEHVHENMREADEIYLDRVGRFEQRDEDRILRRAAIRHLIDLGANRWQPVVQGVPVETPEFVEGTPVLALPLVADALEHRIMNPLFN